MRPAKSRPRISGIIFLSHAFLIKTVFTLIIKTIFTLSAMTRLDHNRAAAQVAHKCGTSVGNVKNVIIWGNHSSTQFPDVRHAKVAKGGFFFRFQV